MKELEDVSIRGRVAYALCSLERLLAHHDANVDDWGWVLERLWQYTDANRLDDWILMAAELLPECVLEDGPEEFEVISESEHAKLRKLYRENADSVNEMMGIVYDIGTDELFGSIPERSPATLAKMQEAVSVLRREGIEPPDPQPFKQYAFSENNGWGRRFDGRHLSCFLSTAERQSWTSKPATSTPGKQ